MMSAPYTPPSTKKGLKRLAKRIRKEAEIKHADALERASVMSGFNNLPHALSQMSARTSPRPSSFALYLSAYWLDREKPYSGRETLRVDLPAHWSSVISPREFRGDRRLASFRRMAQDHLQYREVIRGQSSAREALRSASRALVFAAATGLRPANSVRASNAFDFEHRDKLPGTDHATFWSEGLSERWVMVDEPYELAVAGLKDERSAWAKRHGLELLSADWTGMHAPGQTAVDLFSDAKSGADLKRIANGLATAPREQEVAEWNGESGPYRPVWQSPAQVTAGITYARPPHDGSRPFRRVSNSIGYGGYLTVGRRRPDARMPLAIHQQVAGLLKDALAVTWTRTSAHSQIDRVRSLLDDWVQREHNHQEMPNEIFHNLYYAEGPRDISRHPSQEQKQEALGKLREVGEVLKVHYPECKPRRDLLLRLDRAEKSIHRWKSPTAGATT